MPSQKEMNLYSIGVLNIIRISWKRDVSSNFNLLFISIPPTNNKSLKSSLRHAINSHIHIMFRPINMWGRQRCLLITVNPLMAGCILSWSPVITIIVFNCYIVSQSTNRILFKTLNWTLRKHVGSGKLCFIGMVLIFSLCREVQLKKGALSQFSFGSSS